MRKLVFAGMISAIFLGTVLISDIAQARPEYAVRQRVNCSACHVTPWGGGPRMVLGKTYASRDFGPARTSTSDLFYGDLRLIAYYPTEQTSQSVNGVALMEAAVTGNVPVSQGDNGAETRAVLTYNIASLGGSQVREAYVRWQVSTGEESAPLQIVLGHFYVPFGLLTDEHRTYTRIQTNMTLNNYQTGASLTGGFGNRFRYDVALVSDFQTGGALKTGDLGFGGVVNLQWYPSKAPFLLGASANYQRTLNQPQPFAYSLYLMHSVERFVLALETVFSKNWNNPAVNTGQINPGFATFFIPSSQAEYLNSLTRTPATGIQSYVKYDIHPHWQVFYKLDFLAPDNRVLRYNFQRHGFGIESRLSSNIILNFRFEKAYSPSALEAGDPSAVTKVLALQDDFFAMFRFWL